MSLAKSMSVPQGVVLAVCTIIGSGLLGLPGIAVETGGRHAAALAWPITILLSLPLVAVFLSLSLKVQNAGGIARYASIALGDWAESSVSLVFAVTFMLCIPIGTYMGSAYIQRIFGLAHESIFFIAVGVLVVSTAVNYVGVKPASWVNVASALSLVSLVLLFVLSRPGLFWSGLAAYGGYLTDWRDVDPSNLWTVCAILFWAFLGWENLSFGSEEVKGGPRAIKLIFGIGFVVVTTIYVALAIVATGAGAAGLDISGISGLLNILEGSDIAILAFIMIILVVIANVNAWVFAASRLIYSAGRAGILPGFLGRLSANNLPRASLLSMLAIYSFITACISMNVITVAEGLLLANQNFIVIYATVVACYFKLNRSFSSRLIAVSAAVSSAVLISGFRWTLLVPIALAAIGYITHIRGRSVAN